MTEQPGAIMHTLSPHLVCAGAADAIEFYKAAFGATELMRLADPSGKLAHGCISLNGSTVMLVDEYPDHGALSPKALGGTPVTLHLIVADVDAAVERAISAGATVVMPVSDMFWGDRYGVIADPFGHHWSIATPQPGAPKTSEELAAAMSEMAGGCGPQ